MPPTISIKCTSRHLGDRLGLLDGLSLGLVEGLPDGDALEDPLGLLLDGELLGLRDAETLEYPLGLNEGDALELPDGLALGDTLTVGLLKGVLLG